MKVDLKLNRSFDCLTAIPFKSCRPKCVIGANVILKEPQRLKDLPVKYHNESATPRVLTRCASCTVLVILTRWQILRSLRLPQNDTLDSLFQQSVSACN